MDARIKALTELHMKSFQERLKTPNEVRESIGLKPKPENNGRFDIVCYECRLTYTPIKDGYSNEDKIQINVVGESIVRLSCSNCGTEIHIHDGEDYINGIF